MGLLLIFLIFSHLDRDLRIKEDNGAHIGIVALFFGPSYNTIRILTPRWYHLMDQKIRRRGNRRGLLSVGYRVPSASQTSSACLSFHSRLPFF
jgi:hypothetical protein